MACFEECGCTCYEWPGDAVFDSAIERETRINITLRGLVETHPGWYSEGADGIANNDVTWIGLRNVPGVYVLWQQADYCSEHNADHLRAFYVGKAGKNIEARLKVHQGKKQINDILSTQVSIWQGPNRLAKYIEQLLLDSFSFPLNGYETGGTLPLCHHILPAAWN
ncbi:hypothetical protein J2X46_000882 [Nocardioides sp. BE266]|uniref:hypothetical protein n=1 Tax=Nocardioides sp. BE266 TaxID=2817725 RepID=UPI0028640A52|nr:hypothetical protein [Nocardioides sp. BE266]MDR7251906.1 hypothetical protein [Nocardioides sp. BE266]